MKISKLLAATALTVLASAANAESFNFTYEFWSGGAAPVLGHTVTGSFDGIRNGNLVTGLSHVSVFRDGVAFVGNGSLYTGHVGNLSGSNWMDGGAVASFDGTQNDLLFTDVNHADAANNLWHNTFSSNSTPNVGTTGYQYYRGISVHPLTVARHWHLKAVTAVPEPETYAMLLAGLGLIGAVARRRKNQQV